MAAWLVHDVLQVVYTSVHLVTSSVCTRSSLVTCAITSPSEVNPYPIASSWAAVMAWGKVSLAHEISPQ